MGCVGLTHLLGCTNESVPVTNLHVRVCLMTGCRCLTGFIYQEHMLIAPAAPRLDSPTQLANWNSALVVLLGDVWRASFFLMSYEGFC